MVVSIFVRRNKDHPSRIDIKTSLQREDGYDSPRINNLCLEINQALQDMTGRLLKVKNTPYSKG